MTDHVSRSRRVPELPIKALPVRGPVSRSAYNAREPAGAGERAKAAHRDWVADFLIRHHAPTVSPSSARPGIRHATAFTFPGESWSFERGLASRWGVPVYHVAVEWCSRTLLRGLKHMPGAGCHNVTVPLGVGTVEAWHSDSAAVLGMRARDFLTAQLYGKWRPKEWHRWTTSYKHWTCAWLDFTSPLGEEVNPCLFHLHSHVYRACPSVPVAVSFMVGREDESMTLRLRGYPGDARRRRVALAAELLGSSASRPFELLETIATRTGRVSMLTVAGLIRVGDHLPPLADPRPAASAAGLHTPARASTGRHAVRTAVCDGGRPVLTYDEVVALKMLTGGGRLLLSYSPCRAVSYADDGGTCGAVDVPFDSLLASGWVDFAGFTSGGLEAYVIAQAGRDELAASQARAEVLASKE